MYLNCVIESRQKNLNIVVCVIEPNSKNKDRLILKKMGISLPKKWGVKNYISLLKGLKILVPNKYIVKAVICLNIFTPSTLCFLARPSKNCFILLTYTVFVRKLNCWQDRNKI